MQRHALVPIDTAFLKAHPLPMPAENGDKEARGRVLIVAGSAEMPGAAILAGVAALRAGAGKVALAVPARIAQSVAIALPEARVHALAETAEGLIDIQAVETLKGPYAAVLIGPGMQGPANVARLVCALLPRLGEAAVILDACAMDVLLGPGAPIERFERPVLLTPHAGELAHLSGYVKESVLETPAALSIELAQRWNAYIALKGSVTHIVSPEAGVWRHQGGNVGLATSGSGDALAGIIVGLAARGAPLTEACAWGVALHARAGERLAERYGPIGYLAREIADEIPALMQALSASL